MTSDAGIGGSSRALRQMGVEAVKVRGEVVHPECRKQEELRMTVQFIREVSPYVNCERCDQSLARVPR